MTMSTVECEVADVAFAILDLVFEGNMHFTSISIQAEARQWFATLKSFLHLLLTGKYKIAMITVIFVTWSICHAIQHTQTIKLVKHEKFASEIQ